MNGSVLNRELSEKRNMEKLFAERQNIYDIALFEDMPVAGKRKTGKSGVKTAAKRQEVLAKGPVETARLIIQELAEDRIGSRLFCFHIPKKNERSFIVQGMDFKEQVVPYEQYVKSADVPLILSKKALRLKGFRLGSIRFSGAWIAYPLKGNALVKATQAAKALGSGLACVYVAPLALIWLCLKDPIMLSRFSGFKDGKGRKIDIYLKLGSWD